jgi:hypothetical protein
MPVMTNGAMSDGRSFTNYLSSSQYNTQLQAKCGAGDNNQYRACLQTKADAMLLETRKLKVFSTDPTSTTWNK